jgi:CubicO group peptidase (beta-lactamase class C family)
MRLSPLFLLLALACPFTATAAAAQAAPADTGVAARIGRFVADSAGAVPFSGTIAVSRGGALVFSRGYGLSHREEDVTVTPRTRFLIGSVTKQMTAAAVLMLQDRGRLNVHDPVCRHVSRCSAAWAPVTIHHLLTHTSGIPDIFALGFGATRAMPRTHDQLVDIFRDQPLGFRPGSRFQYSNSAYILLGEVVERAAGQPYASFVRDSIFARVGMGSTGFWDNAAVVKHLATGYVVRDGTWRRGPYEDRTTVTAEGNSTYSTAEDLLSWMRALHRGGGLLSPGSLKAMLASHVVRDGDGPRAGQGYGYGWYVHRELGRPVYSHPGIMPGYWSYVAYFPDDDVAVAVLSNSSPNLAPIVRAAAAAVFSTRPRP